MTASDAGGWTACARWADRRADLNELPRREPSCAGIVCWASASWPKNLCAPGYIRPIH